MQEADRSHLENVDADILFKRIGTGNAVLFLGAGFSRNAPAVTGAESPIASELANELGVLAGFDAEGDLGYAAERFKGAKGAAKLVHFLIEKFSLVDEGPSRGKITSAGWRRIYTTNYDLLAERSAERYGKLIKTVEIEDQPNVYWRAKDVCVHINGSIRSLDSQALDTTFKLTNASYLSPQPFRSSAWFGPFRRDLELAQAIVFVGYSLYDIDVKRLLHQAPELKEKTYFVVHPAESERALYTLATYGNVLPIGVDTFAELLAKSLPQPRPDVLDTEMRSLVRYEPSESLESPRDRNVDRLLMFGDLPQVMVDSIVAGAEGAPMLVKRDGLAESRRLLGAGKNIVATSDFGNGKSVFLQHLKGQLSAEGSEVFTIEVDDIETVGDLERLISSGKDAIIFGDDYERYLNFLEAYGAHAPENIRLVLSARTGVHEHHRRDLLSYKIQISEISVDELSGDEVFELVGIFQNSGMWGAQANLSLDSKERLIIQDYRRQFSLALLSILEAPQMVGRVKNLLADLVRSPEFKDTVFAIALLQAINAELSTSLVSETAMNDAIYSAELRQNSSFRELFKVDGGRITTKSSPFAVALVRHQFPPTYIIERLLRVVEAFDSRNSLPEVSRVYKELLRFSVVERLLPSANKKGTLLRYYEELKRRSPWLVNDPHFWLQYAMTYMQFEEHQKAQSLLDQAYSLARNRVNYHTNHIDTQQARLFLEQCVAAKTAAAAVEFFEKGCAALRVVPNDIHKFWQLRRLADVHASQYRVFSKGNQAAFEHACKNAVADIQAAISANSLFATEAKRAEMIRDELQVVVKKIAGSRGA